MGNAEVYQWEAKITASLTVMIVSETPATPPATILVHAAGESMTISDLF